MPATTKNGPTVKPAPANFTNELASDVCRTAIPRIVRASTPSTRGLTESQRNELFPVLDQDELERLKKFGSIVHVPKDTILVHEGESNYFHVVLHGKLAIVLPYGDGTEEHIADIEDGMFTGDTDILNGRSVVRVKAAVDSEVLEISRSNVQTIIQTDVDLSDKLMRTFIARRVFLVQGHKGDIILLGSRYSSDCMRLKSFLSRNGYPYLYVDLEQDPETYNILNHFGVSEEDLPLVIGHGKDVLRCPSVCELAQYLRITSDVDEETVHETIIVGAGPAGLAAGVYAASEGLSTAMVEQEAPGGQAGSSSKIENYLGFPLGISGQDLAQAGTLQAMKFGAKFIIPAKAQQLEAGPGTLYRVHLHDKQSLKARTIIIASGAKYRRLTHIPHWEELEGIAIFYSATGLEARLCEGKEVAIIGGANSAGQAAVFLSKSVAKVHMLVRGSGLSATMSKYLVQRIEATPKIVVHTHTELVELHLSKKNGIQLEAITWENNETKQRETHPISIIFCMAGAEPNTDWLRGCSIAIDEKGFVQTGSDITPEKLHAAGWKRKRQPMLYETTLPGVFAVGDLRSGNVKRVASAVGEGSCSVQLIHRFLAE
ncbi:uncharacterized protein SPPG_08220 [Spizellomyces punctatus DAOM BR117]|uniref:Cyclic nucleotide-binding domain-containing protein n=1 Tax=Spizellomyces punctatus (strain DAOM BR117) TaxID=645134 RepID=A0A0L0H496_SPIPD|nr:uncharacterized protein SPPG_08220 [Spizellomyces punctatus DAOM BR117]KNC96315.1 hypothetical protein SPPG_08220 [Spizellomyces punctatus DAOM BR117]|eukprot:XP_016604355.1 hypothetical protein SPPG_08220 [Spizellomyces punctatus DAOM BR117]